MRSLPEIVAVNKAAEARPVMPAPTDPQTLDQWQEAALAAAALLLLESARAYGLVAGGWVSNVTRCEEILRGARERGILPAAQLEAEYARALVRECGEGDHA